MSDNATATQDRAPASDDKAQAESSVTVTAGSLFVRSGPTSQNRRNIIGAVSRGTVLDVYEEDGKWQRTLYKDQDGWVYGKYTKDNPQAETGGSAQGEDVEPAKDLPQVEVTGNRLNFRTKPSTRRNRPMAQLMVGEILTVLGREGKWLKVKWRGREGYVYSIYTRSLNIPTPTPRPQVQEEPEPDTQSSPDPEHIPTEDTGPSSSVSAEDVAAVAEGQTEPPTPEPPQTQTQVPAAPSAPQPQVQTQAPAAPEAPKVDVTPGIVITPSDAPPQREAPGGLGEAPTAGSAPTVDTSPPPQPQQQEEAQASSGGGGREDGDVMQEAQGTSQPLEVAEGQFTFNMEGNDNPNSVHFTRRAQVPAPGSGATIGRGFDLVHSGLNEEETYKVFVSAGVSEADAARIAKGVDKKSYSEAKKFAESVSDIVLTHDQQKAIFAWQYNDKKEYAADCVKRWDGTDLYSLSAPMQDMITDLFFRGDMTRSKWSGLGMKEIVDTNDLAALQEHLAERDNWGNVDNNRFGQRNKYMRDSIAAGGTQPAVAVPEASSEPDRPGFNPVKATSYNKRQGLSRKQWRAIQKVVGALPADGKVGPITSAHIYDYQVANGMKDPDGKAGPNTRSVIETGVVPAHLKATPEEAEAQAPEAEQAAGGGEQTTEGGEQGAGGGQVQTAGGEQTEQAETAETQVTEGEQATDQQQTQSDDDTAGDDEGQPEGTDYTEGDDILEDQEVEAAIEYNDNRELRIDWVRKLQSALGVADAARSNDGTFDAVTVQAVARFQDEYLGDPDGKVGPRTRTELENQFETLDEEVIGENLDERTLVPASASDQERWEYYKDVVEASGGVFKTGDNEINLVAIRGAEISGEAGSLEIRQSASAGEYQEAIDEGREHGHFDADGGNDVFDDAIVTVWRTREQPEEGQQPPEGEGGEWTYHIGERPGTVDPGSGTAHLRDGQYEYGTGMHGTNSSGHQTIARRLARDNDSVTWNRRPGSGKFQYSALRARRRIEVLRDTNRDGFLSDSEQDTSEDAIRRRADSHTNDVTIAINIHTSSNTNDFSAGCTNVPEEYYGEFMDQISGSSNTNSILYTVIDASKVDLVLETQEERDQESGG